MKLVFIHGLGSDSDNALFRAIAEASPYEPFYIEYYDVTQREGWTRKIVSLIRSRVPQEPHVLVGHSLGGLLALYAVNESTRGIVLLAPALDVNIGVRLNMYADVMKHGHFYIEFKHPVRMDRKDVDIFFRLMRSAPLWKLPYLIVVGEEDHLINNRVVHRYFSSINADRAWYVEIGNTGHSFVGKEGEVSKIVATFLQLLSGH